MKNAPTAFDTTQSSELLKRLLIILTSICLLGLGLWAWIQQNQSFLPIPDSKSGKALLSQYQGLTHDIWLILLTLATGYLINRIYINKKRERAQIDSKPGRPVESCVQFIRNNPVTTILFAAYTVAMISGTTYLFRDILGWYPDLVQGYFVDNFSLRDSFIDETMRRTDYRFFPLAHQDLHILSWFTIHIKTWMLFSAAELIGIALLSIKFLNNLEGQKHANTTTILLLSSILLIHPSSGTAFFHVIYCERFLCFIFILYINSYLDYLKTSKLSSLYSTLLWALIGIYIKDIAILLFVVPPISLWAADNIYLRLKTKQETPQLSPFSQRYRLEHWLASLCLLFICSYIILALIPSSYVAEGAYNAKKATHDIVLDLRFYLFAFIVIKRAVSIALKKKLFGLLDAINLAALAYAFALFGTYKFDSTSYLSLPFQLIATINIAWAWIQCVEKTKSQSLKGRKKLLGAIITSTAIISADHATAQSTFARKIIDLKFEQNYIQSTYEKLDQISRDIRKSGDDVNIIMNQKSQFSAKRHLNRIPYKSLIEYIPGQNIYLVKDGAGKGSTYTPKTGDIVANLDKRIDLIEPILSNHKTELLYRHNSSDRTGMIRRITAVQR